MYREYLSPSGSKKIPERVIFLFKLFPGVSRKNDFDLTKYFDAGRIGNGIMDFNQIFPTEYLTDSKDPITVLDNVSSNLLQLVYLLIVLRNNKIVS